MYLNVDIIFRQWKKKRWERRSAIQMPSWCIQACCCFLSLICRIDFTRNLFLFLVRFKEIYMFTYTCYYIIVRTKFCFWKCMLICRQIPRIKIWIQNLTVGPYIYIYISISHNLQKDVLYSKLDLSYICNVHILFAHWEF